jgi:hypothetical protein
MIICGCGCGENKKDGDIKIEDWSLPERPLMESGVGYVCACWPSLTGESDACGWGSYLGSGGNKELIVWGRRLLLSQRAVVSG